MIDPLSLPVRVPLRGSDVAPISFQCLVRLVVWRPQAKMKTPRTVYDSMPPAQTGPGLGFECLALNLEAALPDNRVPLVGARFLMVATFRPT